MACFIRFVRNSKLNNRSSDKKLPSGFSFFGDTSRGRFSVLAVCGLSAVYAALYLAAFVSYRWLRST
jgi:hypothetical protein